MGVWLGPMKGEVRPLDLYTAGDENAFTAVGYKWNNALGADGQTPTVEYESNYAEVSVQNVNDPQWGFYTGRSGIVVCGPVDLKKYAAITLGYINDSGTGGHQPDVDSDNARLYVSTSGNSYDESRDTWVAIAPNTSSTVLDVSGLTGSYYVGIALFAPGKNHSDKTGLQITGITVTAD